MSQTRPLTIAILWTGDSAPMAACCRALTALPDTRLVVFLQLPSRPNTAFDHEALLTGVDCCVSPADAPLDRAAGGNVRSLPYQPLGDLRYSL